MSDIKNLTWADLKRIVNKIPESRLQDEVTIWGDDEQVFMIDNVQVLNEDYVDDGCCNCVPRSIMRKADQEYWKENKEDHPVVYPKGTRIINAAH